MKKWIEFMVEVQIRIFLKDKVEVQVGILLRDKQLKSHFSLVPHRSSFFILEKQLASQDMFLITSKLSITAYLFLVLYRSTSVQSLSFLKNIETFLCKQKLVNNCSIPLKQQPYNRNCFSKISGASTALQSLVSQKYRELSVQV